MLPFELSLRSVQSFCHFCWSVLYITEVSSLNKHWTWTMNWIPYIPFSVTFIRYFIKIIIKVINETYVGVLRRKFESRMHSFLPWSSHTKRGHSSLSRLYSAFTLVTIELIRPRRSNECDIIEIKLDALHCFAQVSLNSPFRFIATINNFKLVNKH